MGWPQLKTRRDRDEGCQPSRVRENTQEICRSVALHAAQRVQQQCLFICAMIIIFIMVMAVKHGAEWIWMRGFCRGRKRRRW
ncbi:unnamed protein product [Lota lota]